MQELFPCIVRISLTSLPVYRAAPDTWLTFLDLLILVEKYNISFELWTAIVELAAMKEWDASIYRTFVRHVCDLLVKVDHEKIAAFRPEVAQLMVVMGGYGSHLEKNGEDTSDLCRGIVAAMKEIMGVRCAGATTVHVCVRLAAKPLSVLAYQTPDFIFVQQQFAGAHLVRTDVGGCGIQRVDLQPDDEEFAVAHHHIPIGQLDFASPQRFDFPTL
jgi:hypothetical protein